MEVMITKDAEQLEKNGNMENVGFCMENMPPQSNHGYWKDFRWKRSWKHDA